MCLGFSQSESAFSRQLCLSGGGVVQRIIVTDGGTRAAGIPYHIPRQNELLLPPLLQVLMQIRPRERAGEALLDRL